MMREVLQEREARERMRMSHRMPQLQQQKLRHQLSRARTAFIKGPRLRAFSFKGVEIVRHERARFAQERAQEQMRDAVLIVIQIGVMKRKPLSRTHELHTTEVWSIWGLQAQAVARGRRAAVCVCVCVCVCVIYILYIIYITYMCRKTCCRSALCSSRRQRCGSNFQALARGCRHKQLRSA